MNRTQANLANATATDLGQKLTQRFVWATSGLALVALTLVLLEAFTPVHLPGKPGWPEAVLVCLVTIATLAAVAQQLPAQNVLLAAAIIAVIGGGAHLLTTAIAIPFGPIYFSDTIGPRLFDQLGWPMPLLWIIAVFNSRGVARMILRRYRKLRNYGFWLITTATVLTIIFDTALEPCATHVKQFWLWLPTRIPFTWYNAPLSNFAGWLLTTVLILAFASPSLINKNQRSRKSRVDYHPFVVWMLAVMLFSAVALKEGMMLAAVFGFGSTVTAATLAIRGARW